MSAARPVPRSLEEPARILGLAPMELASCALTYAGASSLLRGVPFSAFLALGVGFGLAITLLILNRTKLPQHGVFWCLQKLRRPILPVMPLGKDSGC
jgi:hypothetical protein